MRSLKKEKETRSLPTDRSRSVRMTGGRVGAGEAGSTQAPEGPLQAGGLAATGACWARTGRSSGPEAGAPRRQVRHSCSC